MVWKVVDVSRYQGDIDWNVMKANGVKGAMLKTVSTNKKFGGLYIDPYFEKNYKECKRLGIAVGVYYYTYAQNKAYADAELNLLKKAVFGKVFEMPIVVDVEENALKPLSREALTDLVLYALKTIESWNAYAQVYTYAYYKQTELDMERLAKHDLWIADYRGKRPTYPHGMWQFSSKNAFKIPGFAQSLDCNYCYKSYPSIIKKAKLNDFRFLIATEPINPYTKTISVGPVSEGDLRRLQEVIEPVVDELKIRHLYSVN